MGNNKEQQGTGATAEPCRGSYSLAGKSQTALQRYKARRMGTFVDEEETRLPSRSQDQHQGNSLALRGLLLLLLLPALGVFGWRAYQQLPGDPLVLTYEIDLSEAAQGTVIVTLIAEGKLPPQMDLEYPPGIFGIAQYGRKLLRPSAHALEENGMIGRPLTVDQTSNGWRLGTRGLTRAGFIYRVDLTKAKSNEMDIRKFISTPVSGGVRFAGFEVFLQPTNAEVKDITVSVYNPARLSVLVPWPALVKNTPRESNHSAGPLADAHLGYGQGYNPAPGLITASSRDDGAQNHSGAVAPVPMNLFYHPHDLADLNNALMVCGNIRTLNSQAKECVIQFATDQNWLFSDHDALDLIRRIARTEMGFFGSSPTEQITVLLSANEIRAAEGFDVYGVHTGSSVLVMISPETTWGMLEEQAASVIAHEMFHGWLGEAITQVDPSTLWFTEGATTWYSARMLSAAGIWTPQHARQVLTDRLNRDYVKSPWRGEISIADAAADVMGDPELVRFAYAGGVAASVALDQWLSRQSSMVRPLDEVLRYLYENRSDEGFSRLALEEAVLAVTGVDCRPWLEKFVYGTRNLAPLDQLI